MKSKQQSRSAGTVAKSNKSRVSKIQSSETFSHPESGIPFEPSEESIREEAYVLYEKGNCCDGRDVDDWFEATAQLKSKASGSWATAR